MMSYYFFFGNISRTDIAEAKEGDMYIENGIFVVELHFLLVCDGICVLFY